MLKLLHLSAAIAAILGAQISSSSLPIAAQTVTSQIERNSNREILTAQIYRSNPRNEEGLDPNLMLALAGLGGGAAAIALAARNNGYFKSQPKARPVAVGGSMCVEQASRHLQKRLMSLLHDERDTANRLLYQAQLKNPNKSVDWYMEKVIYDLKRDRGGY
jgi:hypothetical protein